MGVQQASEADVEDGNIKSESCHLGVAGELANFPRRADVFTPAPFKRDEIDWFGEF
jgi:hypothetical protein